MISLKMIKGSELAEGVQTEMALPPTATRLVIGRDPATHWPIPDRTLALSARHCEIVATPAGMVLRDLSTNGTFVNGSSTRLAGEHLLHDGDRFQLGPYAIVVQGGLQRPAGGHPAPGAAAAVPAPAQREPSVEATAPLRGGDPAAMLGGGGGKREGLTEILRHAPPAEDASLEVTKIRLAPKATGAAPAARPAGTTPMPAVGAPTVPAALAPATPAASAPAAKPAPAVVPPAAPPVVPAPAGTGVDPVLAALASGLGLSAEALAGTEPAEAARQVATLARAGVTALRQLLEQQTLARRQIGSRTPALGSVRDVNPLRLAATTEAALLPLLTPGADAEGVLQRAAAELSSHQSRLLAAFRDAAQRLGEDIAPGSLEAALGALRPGEIPSQHQARLWALYAQVWQGLGLGAGQPWAQGFLEAALMHLASAYDDTRKT